MALELLGDNTKYFMKFHDSFQAKVCILSEKDSASVAVFGYCERATGVMPAKAQHRQSINQDHI
jgi:hypothetical protein